MKTNLRMLKIILINILIFSPIEAISRDNDNALHLGVSTIFGGLGQYHLQNWKYSMPLCMSVGLAKEVLDESVDNNAFSKKDLALDGIGCTLGVLTTSYFWPNNSASPNKLSFSMKKNETSLQYQYLF